MNHKSGAAGTTIVEFAIISIAFFLLIIGLLDVGRGIWTYNSLSAVAREGTRYAIVNGSFNTTPATAKDVSDLVKNKLRMTGVTVNTVWDPDNSRGSTVTVTVRHEYRPIVGLFPSVPLVARSQMAISF